MRQPAPQAIPLHGSDRRVHNLSLGFVTRQGSLRVATTQSGKSGAGRAVTEQAEQLQT